MIVLLFIVVISSVNILHKYIKLGQFIPPGCITNIKSMTQIKLCCLYRLVNTAVQWLRIFQKGHEEIFYVVLCTTHQDESNNLYLKYKLHWKFKEFF